MEKVLKKSIEPTNKDSSNKEKLIKWGLVLVVAVVGSIIAYTLYKDYTMNSLSNLEPMMEEATQFEDDIALQTNAYENIEDQMDEEEYFKALEQPYANAIEAQQMSINELEISDAQVQARGGITSYEELQRVKQPPTDPYAAEELEDFFQYQIKDVE